MNNNCENGVIIKINHAKGEYQIRLYNLLIGWHTLEFNIWSSVESYKTALQSLQHFTC